MFLVDYAETNFSTTDDSDLNDKFEKLLLNFLGLVNEHCLKSRLSKNRFKLKKKLRINQRIF